MIDGVPEEVQQRILDPLQDRPVQLDFASGNVQPDLLPHLAGEVADGAGEPVEDLGHRGHPRLQDPLVHLVGQPGKPATGRLRSSE